MERLKKLEYLSLVSKVCTELEVHIGCSDKILAEFIIDLAQKCETHLEFGKVLKANDAEMPEYFVKTLLTIIHAILPPVSRDKLSKGFGGDKKDLKRSDFPGLVVPDSKQRVRELEDELETDGIRVRVSERGGRDVDGRSGNGRYESGRGKGRDDDIEDGDRGVVGAPMVDEPELYGIYRGRVSRIMDYGCFVQLLGVRDRKEGLVHVHNIASRRGVNAKDAVERDQEVWVKVLSISEKKISLSMRDADQKTGEDLLL